MVRYRAFGAAFVIMLIAQLSWASANRWTQQGPDGGRVSSIAIDPVVTDTVYAVAADGGGLFKTVDGGAAWSRLLLPTDGIRRPVPVLPSTVVIDPFFSRNVWAFTDSQAIRSRNAGDTWTSQSIDDAPFLTIAFSPVRPSLAFAGTGSGVWKSVDEGDHWTSTGLAAPVGLICLDAFDESLILAVEFGAGPVGNQYSVVHRSEDGGASWSDVSVQGASELGLVNAIVADPRHPATFFAATGSSVMKSIDGGKSWSPTAPLPQDVGYTNLLIWDGPLLLVGAGRFASTLDGGNTWSDWNEVPQGAVGALVFNPHEPSTGFFGGISIYKTTDAGVTWGNADSGFHGTEFRALAVDPSDPEILYGSRDEESPERLLISVNGGGHWRATGFSGGVPFGRHITMAIDPEDTATLYASTSTGLAKSTDRGNTWAATGLTFSPFQIEIDPKSGARIYAVGEVGLAASDDGGDHWRTIEPSPGVLVQTIAIDPVDSDVLYATVQLGSQQSQVLKSENRGATWSVLWNTYLTFAPILVDPSNSSIVYADTGNGFFRSTNGGATWSEFNGDLTVGTWGLSIDPANGQVLYARDPDGPVQSVDGGSHWHSLNQGLDLSDRMTSFLVDRSGQHLYVGTYGGGLYTFDFSSSRSVVPVNPQLPVRTRREP